MGVSAKWVDNHCTAGMEVETSICRPSPNIPIIPPFSHLSRYLPRRRRADALRKNWVHSSRYAESQFWKLSTIIHQFIAFDDCRCWKPRTKIYELMVADDEYVKWLLMIFLFESVLEFGKNDLFLVLNIKFAIFIFKRWQDNLFTFHLWMNEYLSDSTFNWIININNN